MYTIPDGDGKMGFQTAFLTAEIAESAEKKSSVVFGIGFAKRA
jgi:hypothetical protein